MGLIDVENNKISSNQSGATWVHESLAQDTVSGIQLKTYKRHSSFITCCHPDSANRKLASGSWDKYLYVWEVETGQILWSAIHEGIVTACHFSSDGKYLVTGSDLDFATCIWDAREGTLIKKLINHRSTVTCCRFSPHENRICTTSMDRTTKIVDMRTFKTSNNNITLSLGGHINVISTCCFSNDEHLVATGSWDKNIQLWDVATGVYRTKGPMTLSKGHEGSISACQFSKDGSTLVSSSFDETLVIWDVENLCQKFALKGHSGWVNDCSISEDQKWVLSCSKDHTVRLWNIESSDDIPVVLEHRKNIGLRIVNCQSCSKPFSITQLEEADNAKFCVFCRLEHPSMYQPVTD
ncbi:hypothetical protein QZH41_009841 [Actinostola sp. cb2023]|nr:hypothetical protein QZH41_009841 [Actinostola sp. cb2023]